MGKFSDVSSCLVLYFCTRKIFASAFLDTIHSLLHLIEFPYPSFCIVVVPQPSRHKRICFICLLAPLSSYLFVISDVCHLIFSFLMINFLLKHLSSLKSSTSVRVLMEFFLFPLSLWQHEWSSAACLRDDGIRMIDKKNLRVTIKIIILFFTYFLLLFLFLKQTREIKSEKNDFE